MMRTAFPLIFIVSIQCVPLISTSVPKNAYDKAKEMWNSSAVKNYTFFQCYWTWAFKSDAVHITVQADTIKSISTMDGTLINKISETPYKSIKELFDLLSKLQNIDTSAYSLFVEYDTLWGYPKIIVLTSLPPNGPFDINYSYKSFGLNKE